MSKVALGFVETRGNTGCVLALDAMIKTADVELVKRRVWEAVWSPPSSGVKWERSIPQWMPAPKRQRRSANWYAPMSSLRPMRMFSECSGSRNRISKGVARLQRDPRTGCFRAFVLEPAHDRPAPQ